MILAMNSDGSWWRVKCYTMCFVLLKALEPVCMKCTAQGESWVVNKAGVTRLTKSYILSYKQSSSALSILLYYALKDLLTEDTPFKFNTFIE